MAGLHEIVGEDQFDRSYFGEDLRMLEIIGLKAGYGAASVLHGVDFTLKQGQFVGLLRRTTPEKAPSSIA